MIPRAWRNLAGLCLAAGAALFVHLCPLDGLSPAGHGVLSAQVFMLVIWVFQIIPYAESAYYLVLAVILFQIIPGGDHLTGLEGREAMRRALSGFLSGAWLLTAGALILAAAMQLSGLGKRLALLLLERVRPEPRNLLLGILFLSFLLSVFIPAQVANAALLISICAGLADGMGIAPKSRLSKGMFLVAAYGATHAGMAVLTSGASTMQTQEFIRLSSGTDISWTRWLVVGLPYAAACSAAACLLVLRRFPVGDASLPGRDWVRAALRDLGPMTAREKKLLCVLCVTLLFWGTGGSLHNLDPALTTLAAVCVLFAPGCDVIGWKELRTTLDWGTLMLFGAAIGLGQLVLETGAAVWLAEASLGKLPAEYLGETGALALILLFFAALSLAFSARTGAVAALVPLAAGVWQTLPQGMTIPQDAFMLLVFYTIQFSVAFPVNSPMTAIAYSTDTFTGREMLAISIPLIGCCIALLLLFKATYWSWLGLL